MVRCSVKEGWWWFLWFRWFRWFQPLVVVVVRCAQGETTNATVACVAGVNPRERARGRLLFSWLEIQLPRHANNCLDAAVVVSLVFEQGTRHCHRCGCIFESIPFPWSWHHWVIEVTHAMYQSESKRERPRGLRWTIDRTKDWLGRTRWHRRRSC